MENQVSQQIPAVQASPVSASKHKYLPLVVLLMLIICIISAARVFFLRNSDFDTLVVPTSTPVVPTFTPTPTIVAVDETVYTNEAFGLSFKYPQTMQIYEDETEDTLMVYLDTDEERFLTVKRNVQMMNDTDTEAMPFVEIGPERTDPFMQISVTRRTENTTEKIFSELPVRSRVFVVDRHEGQQRTGKIHVADESTESGQISVNRTKTLVFDGDYAYTFTYTDDPARQSMAEVYTNLLSSVTFLEKVPLPTSAFTGRNDPILNARPSFHSKKLLGWDASYPPVEKLARVWAPDARLYKVTIEITAKKDDLVRYEYFFVSNIKRKLGSFVVSLHPRGRITPKAEKKADQPISDPQVYITLDRTQPFYTPFGSLRRALQLMYQEEESTIDTVSMTLNRHQQQGIFEGWRVTVKLKDGIDPYNILVDYKTGDTFIPREV